MSLRTRLRERRQALGLTLQQVGDAVGVSKSTVQKWESGEIEDMRLSKAASLAEVLKVSPLWIMGIIDDMNGPYTRPQTKRVPLLGCIAAGKPICATEEWEEYIELSGDMHVDFCLRVRGDSMIDARICDGDLVFIRSQPVVDNGDIAVVLIDDEATLKRFYRTDGGVILKPENSRYEPRFYSHRDFKQVRVLGRAVLFQSRL